MWNSNILFDSFKFAITKVIREKDQIKFHVRLRRKTAECVYCGKRSDRVHATNIRTIQHGTILLKSCVLILAQRRFFCLPCQRVFSEEIDFVERFQRVTPKHKKEVVDNLSDRSFSSGTKRYAVSYHTQRKWLKELIFHEVCNFKEEGAEATPFVLGIDEVSFAGRDMLTTIGNITKHRLKGVLHSKRKDQLKKILRCLPSKVKSLISEVVIDMSKLYLFAVKETLPKEVRIVVDHFHVIQDANRRRFLVKCCGNDSAYSHLERSERSRRFSAAV